MKTLLQINVVANSGSTGRIAEEIGQLAICQGWKSYIAFGRSNPVSTSELIRIGNKWDMYQHGLQSRVLDNHGLASKGATRDFIQKIESINPDIVHLHNIHGYYINYKFLFDFLRQRNIPTVWTLHDCWSFTGHCSHFSYINCIKWKTQCFNCPQKKSYPSSLILDNSQSNYLNKKKCFTSLEKMVIVPVSNWLTDLAKQSFLKDFPIKRIYNGIDTDIFKPMPDNPVRERYGLKKQFVILGVTSVWSSRKGLEDFMRLAEMLPSDYKIILVGLSPSQLKRLSPRIIGISKTENISQLVEFYSAADVFVNLSWEDNFPTTNIEALACGTPVITYQTGGSPEAVDSSTGMVIPQGNLNEIVLAIQKIKERSKSFYQTFCRERAFKYYKKEDRYEEYMKLYRELLFQNKDNHDNF